MSAIIEAWGNCIAAVREHDSVVSKQARVEASRRPVSRRRQEIDALEQERRHHEQELELAMIELLEACNMVNDTWTDARTRDERLTGYVQALLEV